ncbi:hypothetical protein JCM11491_004446 [Sporobolomyces phaffii]
MAIHLTRPREISRLDRARRPEPGPNPEPDETPPCQSSLRSSLVATSRQLRRRSLSPSPSNRSTIVPAAFVPSEDEDDDLLNEVVISRDRTEVEWVAYPHASGQRGVARRTWTYHHLGESIALARVVHFPSPPSPPPPTPRSTRREPPTTKTWGPYRTRKETTSRREWTDELLNLPTEPPLPRPSVPVPEPEPPHDHHHPDGSPTSSSSSSLRPYLVVVLSTLAFVHPLPRFPFPLLSGDDDEAAATEQGGGIPIHLAFRVADVFPLARGGALFLRAREGPEALLSFPRSTTTTDDDDNDETVPIWWTLGAATAGSSPLAGGGGGYAELEPVLVVEGEASSSQQVSPSEQRKEKKKKTRTTTMRDLDERVVFVSNEVEHSTLLRVAVTVNELRGKVTVWSYDDYHHDEYDGELEERPPAAAAAAARRREPNNDDDDEDRSGEPDLSSSSMMMNLDVPPRAAASKTAPAKKHRRPSDREDLSSEPPQHSTTTTVGRAASSAVVPAATTTTTTSRRRRSTRLSLHPHHPPPPGASGGGGPDTSSNDLLAAAAAAAACSPESQQHRRTSLTRNDLSVTMDRMALSQGSSLGGGGPPTTTTIHSGLGLAGGGGPGGGGDVLDREATVYLGEGEWIDKVLGGPAAATAFAAGGRARGRAVESNHSVEWTRVWQGDLDGTSARGISVALFDQRATGCAAAAAATLSVLLPDGKTLLLLSLTTAGSSSSFECVPFKQVAATSACTVRSTRRSHGIDDLLVLSPSSPETETRRGRLRLVTAHGEELDVVCDDLDETRIDEVRSNGSRSVTVSSDGGRKRQLTSLAGVPGDGGNDDGLGGKVLHVLAQVLGVRQFGHLFERVVVDDDRDGDGFARVRRGLDELFEIDRRGGGRGARPVGESDQSRSSSFLARLRRPQSAATATVPPSASNATALDVTAAHCAVVFALHLLVQSLRVRTSTLPDARELAIVVADLASAVGLRGWIDDYRRTWGPAIVARCDPPTLPTPAATPRVVDLLPTCPPNIVAHLADVLSCSPRAADRTFALSSIADLFFPASSSEPRSFFYGTSSCPLASLANLLEIYSLLAPSRTQSRTPTERAHAAVVRFHALGWTLATLDDVAFGISVPIREAIRTCQLDPPPRGAAATAVPAGVWTLVGRRELEPRGTLDTPHETALPLPHHPRGDRDDIDSVVRGVEASLAAAAAAAGGGSTQQHKGSVSQQRHDDREQDEPDLNPIPRAARFNEDKRMEEVARMLQYVEPVVIAPGEKTLDQLTPQAQQSILSALSHRTLALPVGAAMYHLGSVRPPASSDALEIPPINTSARILPMPSPVALADKERDTASVATVPDRSEWPDFHAGVAAALGIDDRRDSGAGSVDSSRISFNRPAELDARHAGLVLGLGLGGHLDAMLTSQAYDYLKQKHDPTSVAVLLGLAVTYLGTSDATVTSVISIHLPALHPPRSSSLNVSGLANAAAAVALGLVHFATGRRSLADVLVRELCGISVTTVEDAHACREAYALSCGFAFGYIMLGRGSTRASTSTSTSSNEAEVDLVRVFRALILGEDDRPLPGAFHPPQSSSSKGAIDVNLTSPAATVALALMFLRTERRDVADVFEIPDSPRRLDYVRADVLLLRQLGRYLVLWDSVTPTKDWIESTVPAFLATAHSLDPDSEVARWSLIAGACFAVGFKYAGTATAEAHATLIHYMDRLTRACYVKAPTVQSKIKRHSLRTSLGVVSIALAMVMAGTGELNVLRRLRVAHGHFSEGLTYGYHLSTHMALGLLFLGNARQTLSNSNGAVAALLCALYPVFPATATDNRAHLQAYRHLWVLAAEPRYLDARDIDSGEPVFLPVRLRLVDDHGHGHGGGDVLKAKQLVAPTLIPDVRTLDSIQVESPRYWGYTVRLDGSSDPDEVARFLTDGTLFVKRRTGHLSYAQDPRGIRSIFTRSKSEQGAAVYDFGHTTRVLNPSAAGLRDFVAAFSDDSDAIAATEHLCVGAAARAGRVPSKFEAFAASVLLECLTKDKRVISSVYHAMYHAHALVVTEEDPGVVVATAAAAASETLVAFEQLGFVVDFYLGGTFKAVFGGQPGSAKSSSSTTTREPLVNPAFIDHVAHALSSRIAALSSSSSSLLSTYLANPGTWPLSSSGTPSAAADEVALALELAYERVPDLAAVHLVARLVRQHAETTTMTTTGRDGVDVLLRATAKALERRGVRAWSSRVSNLLIQQLAKDSR